MSHTIILYFIVFNIIFFPLTLLICYIFDCIFIT